MQEQIPRVLLVLRHRRNCRRVCSERNGKARARLEEVHQSQADDQGDRRGHFEIHDRFQTDTAERFQVSRTGDANHERGKEQRRDDHLDQPQEGVGQRANRDTERWPEVSNDDA